MNTAQTKQERIAECEEYIGLIQDDILSLKVARDGYNDDLNNYCHSDIRSNFLHSSRAETMLDIQEQNQDLAKWQAELVKAQAMPDNKPNKQKIETAVRMIIAAVDSIKEEMQNQQQVGSETFQIYNLALSILDKSRNKEDNS